MPIEESVRSVLLADTQADYINGLSAQRLFSASTIEAVGQGLIETNGRGITDKFTASADVMASAEIVVRRIKPFKPVARELGQARNGGYYGKDGHYSQSENVSIKTMGIIDDLILIPNVAQAMIPVELASVEIANFVIGETNILNGMTFAEKFFATYCEAPDKKNEVSYTDGTDNLAIKCMEARQKLFKGDAEHGFFTFPDKGLVYVLQSDWYATFYAKGVLVLNNGIVSGEGQGMVAKGGISPNAIETVRENGYVGMIGGIPVHIITPYVVSIAEDFLGLPYGDLDAKYMGYLSSDVGTARGVSTQENFKVVDDPRGQGIIIQPLVKYGCKCFYQKANAHLVQNTFVNPFVGLKTLWASDVNWCVKGVGSRLLPTITFTAVTKSSGFTVSAEVYADLDTAKSTNLANATICYVQTDAPVSTFGAFYSAYTTQGAVKGTATSGSAKSEASLAANKYLNICAVGSDGTVAIASKKIPA